MIGNINRNGLAIILLFLALIAASFFFAEEEASRPYDLASTETQGLAALRLWLDDLGYDVVQTGQRTFDLGSGNKRANLLFVFPNRQTYTDAEADIVSGWVEMGGTLVLIGPDIGEAALTDEFGVFTEAGALFSRGNEQRQPLLPDADGQNTRASQGVTLNLEDAPAAVPVLGLGNNAAAQETLEAESDSTEQSAEQSEETEEPERALDAITAAVQKRGEGTVWHITPRYEPINALLREPEVAQLVVAFLRTVPTNGTILFDTYHLFGAEERTEESIRSVRDWLYRTSIGQAVIFAALATMLYLFIQGRRLGPPLPSTSDPKRREAAEYVEAMAGLHRRANQRQAVATYHKQRLKAALGQPLHLDPTLPDATFVEQLQRADHRFSDAKLRASIRLVQQLGSEPSEAALIDLVAGVDQVLNE